MKQLRESILDDDFLGDVSFLAPELEKIIRAAEKRRERRGTHGWATVRRQDIARIVELARKEGVVPPTNPGEKWCSRITECNVVLIVYNKSRIRFIYRYKPGSEWRSLAGTWDSDMKWEVHVNDGFGFSKDWIGDPYVKEVYMLPDAVWEKLIELENY